MNPKNAERLVGFTHFLRFTYALGTRTELWSGCGCSGYGMLLEHERYSGLGMDVLVNICSPLEQKRNYGLGMDALVQRMLLERE